YVLLGHDVTRRAEAERHAAIESALLTAIQDNLDVVVWAIDRQANFLYQNGRGTYAAGLRPGDLLGKNLLQMYAGSPDYELATRALAGEPAHGPATQMHDRFWDSWFIPVPDNPSGAAVVGVSLDVTDTRRRELELRERIELIERQQETIRALSTPIIEVWEGVLTMPIVGLVDSMRAADVMNNLLQAVTETRARFAILDLTGVDVVDTGTASHLIEMIHAIRMLGAEGILTGIRPAIAQTIVALDVDLSKVAVFAKLRDALKHCIRAGAGRRA
ncbi:MAG TPA: STAS domain-containing protein, partial [Nannocystis sp.]